MKENYRQLQATAASNRAREEESQAPKKTLYKLGQFKNVESRLFEPTKSRKAVLKESKTFVQRGDSERRMMDKEAQSRASRAQLEKATEEAKYFAGAEPEEPVEGRTTPRKAAVPKDRGIFRHRDDVDFISSNRMNIQVASPNSPRKSAADANGNSAANKHSSFGNVPAYLNARKAQWAREEELEAQRRANADCPKGMMLMPEHERLETLETLQESKIECIKQLAAMPFVVETASLKKRQASLEARLKEIEGAVGIFSKDKVYVKKT
jgi:hypothetical protein